MNVYDLGDTVKLKGQVAKAEVGSAPAFGLTIKDPKGVVVNYTPASEETTTHWCGVFELLIPSNANTGKWTYKFSVSGSAVQVQYGEFFVRAALI
jgi:hypothetical protein